MKLELLAFILLAACSAPEQENGEPDGVGVHPDPIGAEQVKAARRVFSGCTSQTFDIFVYSTTYDAFGWELSSDYEDTSLPFDTTNTYERDGDEVIASVTEYENGNRQELTYDDHEHRQSLVDTHDNGAQVDPITYVLEHDGERLLSTGYTYQGTSYGETLDDCENVVQTFSDDEVFIEQTWEYERDCLPSRAEAYVPSQDIAQTILYEGGRPIQYIVTDLGGSVTDVVWDCP